MRRNLRGFTVIEVLMALTIFSVVALCLFSIFVSGIKLSHRFEKQGNTYRQLRWPFDVMEKDFMNIVFYDFSRSYPDRQAFQGEEDNVTFIVSTGNKGLKVIRYYLETPQKTAINTVILGKTYKKNVDGVIKSEKEQPINYLIREERDFVDYLSDDKSGIHKKIVARDVKEGGLKLNYAFFDVQNQQLSWGEDWHSGSLPSAIRVEMEVANFQQSSLKKDFVIPVKF